MLQSNSFIAYKLTGEFTQELSQGLWTALFDMRRGTWDMDMCRELGIEPGMLPGYFPLSSWVVGKVTVKAAADMWIDGRNTSDSRRRGCGLRYTWRRCSYPGETQEQGGQAGGMVFVWIHTKRTRD